MNTMDEFEKALDAIFRDNEIPMNDENGKAYDKLRTLHRAALEDAERYRWLRDSSNGYANDRPAREGTASITDVSNGVCVPRCPTKGD